jgi:tyrosyl-tRNA synthetase
VQDDQIPDDIDEYSLNNIGSSKILDIVDHTNILSSRGEIKRLIKQGGITIDDNKINDVNHEINESNLPITIQVGKRNWFKLIK